MRIRLAARATNTVTFSTNNRNVTPRFQSIATVLVVLYLTACGGGGSNPSAANAPPGNNAPPGSDVPGTNPPPAGAGATFSTSTRTLEFFAVNRIGTPPPQRIPLTVSGNLNGSLYVTVGQITGDAIGASSVSYSARNGQASADALIYPPLSGTFVPGVYTGTITLNACVDDPTCQTGQLQGSPLTVDVVYTVEDRVQGDIVAPRVVTAGEPGTAIIRGRGFGTAPDVRFGSVAATSVRVIGDTEIRATYPALAAGEYPVSINSGEVPFTGSLVAVPAPVYAPDVIEYRASPPEAIGGVVYDAERQALIVVGRNADSRNNSITRFEFEQREAGLRWIRIASSPVSDIRDVALSPDGKVLLGATSTSLMELNPVTFNVLLNAADPPAYAPSDAIKSGDIQKLAIANDGYAVVTTGGTGPTNVYLYSTTSHRFYTVDFAVELPNNVLPVTAYFGSPAVSGDGSILAMTQEQGASRPGVHQYNASFQRYSILPVADLVDLDRSSLQRSARPALDRAGTRIVLNGATTVVVDQDYSTLGRLPDTTRAAVVKPDASRVYTFDAPAGSESGELRTFDLRSTTVDGRFQQIGAGIPMSPGSGTGAIQMVITPDGGTIFVVGIAGVWVQPAP